MGMFSNAWKSIKKTFKSIGKSIKKAANSVGKFMDKIGVVGQIALTFVLPGIGGLLAKGLGAGVGAMVGSTNALASGVGKILQTAGKFASTVGNAYKTVTDGIGSFISNVSKGTINQVGNMLGAKSNLLASGPSTISEGFNTFMKGVADDVQNIPSAFRTASATVEKGITSSYDKDFGLFEGDSVIQEPFGNKGKDFRFYDVPKESFDKIVTTEKAGFTKFVGDIGNYAVDTVKSFPNKAVDMVSDTIVSGVGDKAAQSIGLKTQPEYNVQNVTNVVPQFNSAPIQKSYEASGINYGATPQSRIEYFAATSPYGDYGSSAFNNFSTLRTI